MDENKKSENIYGSNLLKLRKQKKISQEELAKFINSTKSTISKYERGVVDPTLDVAKRIASYFGTTVDQMTRKDYTSELFVTESSCKELIGLPKAYIKAIKIAEANEITPDKLIELIEFSLRFNK